MDSGSQVLSEKRDESKTLDVLYEISRAVSRTRDLNEFYANIHTALNTILDADNFYIALHHEDRDSITFPYHVDERDENPEEVFNFSETSSLTGQVIASRQPRIFYEKDILDFARQQEQDVIGTPSKIWLGAPLIIRNRVIGAVAIQSFDSTDAYDASDLNLLNTISQHIALAIERKEAEEELKSQQQVLATILESSPVGICLTEHGTFKWVNTRMVSMFGYQSKEDLTEKSTSVIYGSVSASADVGRRIQSGLKQLGRADFDYEMVKADGTRFKAHLIVTRAGKPAGGMIGTIADLSQLETAREERLEKERLQGVLEMAGAICHEINQPLQTILGYTALIDSSDTVPVKAMDQIKSQADRIAKITNRLSRITRYKTISYPGDATIVDIWGASATKEP